MTIKIQYASDLHLEFKEINIIPKLFKDVNADILVLAGDVCPVNDTETTNKFIKLLQYVTPKYQFVFHVLGNHGYYTENKAEEIKTNTMTHVNRKFASFKNKFPNYIYLDCNSVTLSINGSPYTFIGATLWTKVKDADWLTIEKSMNDYNSIFTLTKGIISKFNVNYMQMIHKKHRNFIKREINKQDKNIPIILITHHRPILPPGGHKSKIDQAYTTDMSNIIKAPVVASISGHCHSHLNIVVDNIRYLSNPKGYPGQHCGYRNDAFIEI
jgi:predicted MPP superfamily phosphohydrolase